MRACGRVQEVYVGVTLFARGGGVGVVIGVSGGGDVTCIASIY